MTSEEFTKIYKDCFNLVFFTALKMIENRKDAEDVAADVFTKLWQTDVSEVKFIPAWLYRCTHNKCLNIIRRKEKVLYGWAPDAEAEPLSDYIMEIRMGYMQVVLDRIQKMPEQCAKVCKLSFIQNLENSEIADQLKMAIKTVQNQKIIGMGILKQNLQIK